MPPFDKILVANRGEIACRVIRTCRRLGIKTVAVYSDADADALHVREADEAVRLGPPPSAQSYLQIDAIVAACKATGAEAVHPGYGFLSENPAFASALEKAGIVFIGPTMSAVAAMGDKIESKKLAQKAGVNMVPGHLAAIADAEEAVKIARGIGYPVMIKASAGGGGKGMRIAHNDAEAREGFRSATNEAKSAFGDDRVFIEKFIEEPRHIEIQVLGDSHGHVIHLGERECSIQRRHQKVIEEAPSPFLDAKTRAAMGAQAVALAKAVDYRSAGTVEFIVDRNRNFYFLEMNTRLQVEHPVTELITGVDLVELMIRSAAGEKLPFKQSDVKLNGWAVESRVYAEDPFRNFLPSIGRLVKYRPPEEGTKDGVTVRNDTGVFEGGEISMFYDPMIAKLVTHAPTRLEAIDSQAEALDSFYIDGIQHNIPFLTALMQHPRWRKGALSTGFIKEEFPDGFIPREAAGDELRVVAAVAAVIDYQNNVRRREITQQMTGRPVQFARRRIANVGKTNIAVEVDEAEGSYSVDFPESGGKLVLKSDWRPGDPVWKGMVGDDEVAVQVRTILNGVKLSYRGIQVPVYVYTEREAALVAEMPEKVPADTSKFLLCPMPGLVKAIHVAEGQEVQAGDALAVVEAMKMENILRAERDGKVTKINAKAGDSLAVDAVILEFA